jgi:hypothetical protein
MVIGLFNNKGSLNHPSNGLCKGVKNIGFTKLVVAYFPVACFHGVGDYARLNYKRTQGIMQDMVYPPFHIRIT